MLIDLIGQRFGRLIIIKRMDNDKWGGSKWLCQCDCGQKTIVTSSHLKSSGTKSCGCFAKEQTIKRSTKHGHSTKEKTSRTYESWHSMITRCTNPNYKEYKNYGGRGITVCKCWMKFENFLEDMGERPNDKLIERINNNQGYNKGNCRWATWKEQARNRRNNRYETCKEKTQLLIKLSEETGINYNTLVSRIKKGWTAEEAFAKPVQERRKFNGN